MQELIGDLRAAIRSMAQAPRSILLIPLCLALGLGANAAMFGVADTLFFRAPAGVRDAGAIARFYFRLQATKVRIVTTDLTSFPIYTEMRDGTKSFEKVAAYQLTAVSEGRGAAAVKLSAALVSADYFSLLNVSTAAGRVFSGDESRVGGAPAAVISDALWRSRFGASKAALGQTLWIAGRTYPIVGVARRSFTGVDLEPADVWIPLEVAANDLIRDNYLARRGAYQLALLARVKPAVTRAQAEEDATRSLRNSLHVTPGMDTTGRAIVAPLLRELGPNQTDQAKVAIWLAGVAVAVLLIAGVNCTNLMLLRALRRRREFAVRLALGAARERLAKLVLTESVLLSLAGAVAAFGVGIAGSRLLHRLLLSDDAAAASLPLTRLGMFTFAAALATGLLASVPSVASALRSDPTHDLRVGVRAGLPSGSRLRGALLAAQVGLTMVLLVGAGLFIRSLQNVRALDLGFDPANVLVVNIDFAGMSARAGQSRDEEFYRRVEDAAGAIPGINSVAVSTSVPFQYLASVVVGVPGRDSTTLPKDPVWMTIASEGFRRTLGLRLVAGRWFDQSDYGSGGTTVVINESMAKAYFPGESAVGQCLLAGEPQCRTVVGVLAETHLTKLTEEHRYQLYVGDITDAKANARLPRTVLVSSQSPRATIGQLRRAVQSVDPTLAYVTVRPLGELIEPSVRPWRLGAIVFAQFGVLALALAAFGLFGAMNHVVSERTHELAVRIALGARSGNVVWLVLRRGAVVMIVGVALGAVAALLGGQRLSTLLFAVSPRDTAVFVAACATLAAAGLAACYSPLRRATGVDPMAVLRQE